MEQKEKITVLYIDDEENNLHSFKATFRFDYNVLLAQNTQEADTHLNNPNNNIQVILCDQRMPTVTGVAYFEKVRLTHPTCVRMLITGFSDIESVIEAINVGHIFRYIKKPWVDTDIKSAIEEAYRFYLATSMLEIKLTELQRAYQELNKFAYTVAHDFKGPVNSIKGALEVLAQEHQLQQNELLKLIIASSEKLQEFIDSMFDYYRLNQGELVIEDINAEDLANYYKELHALQAELDNIAYTFTIKQLQPFRSDLHKLKIILNNIIGNAFKYLRQDEPQKTIAVSITIENENACIQVTDNGIGIDPQYLDSIFDMFYRANTHAPGSGFGLYNVKDAVAKLGGQINVTSTPNLGSQFTVTIPTK
ncbi:MAG: hybrid sensor histidine kinase/response regulator [Bacteroidia bacterium]|nr:hybrid sensor histidine kinase/response regulator [Bacteroidia bacterium]